MSDLIDRQAAIDALWGLDAELRPSAIDAILNMLNGLPSAQPETNCSEFPNNSDTISRQAAIDAINSYFGFNTEEEYGSAVQEVINGLPSAQPETNCSEFPNNSDTISRQAAIDAIDNANDGLVEDDYTYGLQSGMEKAKYIIEDLPSAQPETAKRIVGKSRDGMTLWYQCDMCNEPVDVQDIFCRGCGRRLTDE